MDKRLLSAGVFFSIERKMYYRKDKRGNRVYEPNATAYYQKYPWRITANYKFAERTI